MRLLQAGAVLLAGWSIFGGVALAAPKHAAFAGTWNLNSSKSQVSEARDVTITIDFAAEVIKFSAAVKKGSGTANSQFSCDTASGTECPFDEGGHKSKASVYFNGDVLNIWKSDGPAGDVAAQWKVEVSPDGKTLTVTLAHLEPAGKDEVLVFDKNAT